VMLLYTNILKSEVCLVFGISIFSQLVSLTSSEDNGYICSLAFQKIENEM
jgi:hypothetical protein